MNKNSRLRKGMVWNLASTLPRKKNNPSDEIILRLVGDSETYLVYEISEPLVFRKFEEAQVKGCDLYIHFKSIKEYPLPSSPPSKKTR